MTTALTSLTDIAHVILFSINIKRYRVNEGDFPQEETLRFTDSVRTFVDEQGFTYTPLGPLVAIGPTSSDIQVKDDSFTFSISGVPQIRVKEIINSEIKGSRVNVQRVFFETDGTQIVDLDYGFGLGNAGRFQGYINNYSIEDNIDPRNRTSTITINFECNSISTILKRSTRGLRTNPRDLRAITSPPDASFDRVPLLSGENFVWGKPD
jgi:hypothetical protein